jgi:zinc protease
MVLRWRFALAVVAGVTACVASVRESRWAELGAAPDVKTLQNGLRQVTQVDSQGVTALQLTVHAGLTADPAGKEGLAHLVEHLVGSSKAAGQLEWIEAIGAIGAVWANAETDLDETRYYATVPSQQAAVLIDAFAQLAEQPLRGIDDSIFRREQQIVGSEGMLRDDIALPRVIWSALARSLFPEGQPYARATSGTAESVAAIEFADVKRFTAQHYVPHKMTLAVVGSLDGESRRQLERFSALPKAQATTNDTPLAATWDPTLPVGESLQTVHVVNEHPQLWIAWKLPPQQQRLDYEALALAEVIRDRLMYPFNGEYHPLVEDTRLGYSAGEHGVVILGSLRLKKDADPTNVLDWVTAQVRRALFTSRKAWVGGEYRRVEPLRSAYGLATSAWLVAADQAYSRASLLSREAHAGRSFEGLFERLLRPGEAGSEMLQAWAERWLTVERLRAVYAIPDHANVDEPPAVHTRWQAGSSVAPVASPAALANICRPPPTSELESGNLLNGLTYAFLNWPGSRVSTVLLGHNRGVADAVRPEVGHALQLALTRETWLEVGARGILFSRAWSADSSAIIAQSPFEDVEPLAEFVLQREHDEGIRWPDYSLNWREAPRTLSPPFGRAWERLLRDHPWGTSRRRVEVQNVDPAEIGEHYKRSFDANHGVLIAVGDLADYDIRAAIKDAAMRLALQTPAGPATPPEPSIDAPVMWTPHSSVAFEPMQRNSQLAEFHCLLPPSTSQANIEVFGAAMRQALQGRLRIDLAASYGVQWTWRAFRGNPKVITLESDLPLHRAKDALRVWRDFRAQPAATLFTNGLHSARIEALRDVTVTGLSPSNTAWALFGAWLAGEPMTAVGQRPDEIAQTTEAEAIAAFDFCREHSTLTFYGDGRLEMLWEEVIAERGAAVSELNEPARAPLDASAASN